MASWWKSDALQIYGIQVIGLCYDFCISLVVSYVVGQTLHELSTFTALCDWWSACVHTITTARHARSLPHCCHQLSSCMWMLLPARRWTSTKLHLRNASKSPQDFILVSRCNNVLIASGITPYAFCNTISFTQVLLKNVVPISIAAVKLMWLNDRFSYCLRLQWVQRLTWPARLLILVVTV